MEATKEQGAGLLHHILPPRLEDAGLEDSALPPDSIKEAFHKAATAVKSCASSIFAADEDEDDCIKDPWAGVDDRSDAVVGEKLETQPPGPCGGDKDGAVEVGEDKVVVSGEEGKGDKVIVGGEDLREGGDRACVDGLIGLEIGEKKLKKEDKERDGEGPILVGGYV